MNISQFPQSRPIIITPCKDEWPSEFARIEAGLRNALGNIALRVDHIGSTSVPGLAAKDIIDVQVTVQSLDDPRIRQRRMHIHIREQGRFNQRYALLFRDYLRASPDVAKAYETIKIRLAEIFPESIEGYLYIKDPLMDLIFAAASQWAEGRGGGV